METINLSATVARALELLTLNGMSDKSLHAYTHTSFGCIIRHFQSQGVACVTREMLDAFLLEQCDLFEQGNFSPWKWGQLRRGCELLKHCAVSDTITMPSLQPWIASLRKPRQYIQKNVPTAAQLADSQNIFSLVWRTNKAIMELGLADATVGHYRDEGLAIILNKHYASATEQFSEDIIDQLIAEKRRQYKNGQIDRCSYQNLRKAAYLLREMHQTGHIHAYKVPNWGFREPIEPFYSLLNEFSADIEQHQQIAKNSCACARNIVRRFLFEMESQGYSGLADFTQLNINMCVNDFAKHYTGGLRSAIYFLKKFFRFMFEKRLTAFDLSKSLPEQIATRKMFHEGFTEYEIKCLLEQPDRNTAAGKRDYAMIVLAIQSGLRACDIVNLKLSNIDWRRREIRLIQHKTGKPLAVPLEPESGNAIADYVLNVRPNVGIAYLFPCNTGSIRPLNARSASCIVSRYMKKAGIPPNYRAFHALRRTFGTRLLQNNVSFELIQQLLGHADMNSMKPYLSVDEQGLKACALSLLACRKGER